MSTITRIGGVHADLPSVWTRLWSPRLKSGNCHKDREGLGRKTQICRHFLVAACQKCQQSQGSGGSLSQNTEQSSVLDSPLVAKWQQSQGSGGPCRKTQICRHFWTRVWSTLPRSIREKSQPSKQQTYVVEFDVGLSSRLTSLNLTVGTNELSGCRWRVVQCLHKGSSRFFPTIWLAKMRLVGQIYVCSHSQTMGRSCVFPQQLHGQNGQVMGKSCVFPQQLHGRLARSHGQDWCVLTVTSWAGWPEISVLR